jgi:hypothetical protein
VKNSPLFLFGKRYFPLCKFPTFACLCFWTSNFSYFIILSKF